ncbi:actin cortical patch component Aip1 [Schizosaccharomyces octosporus yFS286]|uniref:Actin cortical patch component Aip1 n=1 Tax=Schizosaccharomyces octosporus (strain yFS286) TaxID=483514 RepID=S9R8U5_SCHOY|nr:actin cortical patch component Aip1 [Schizosaccharomyces octosporus yFS286]EPX70519.1 actin cortical patch component Aip1 [Schizosaccharomyces octosporus yFS286]
MPSELKSLWAPAPSTKLSQPCKLSTNRNGDRIAYATNKAIILRNISNPEESYQYNEHTAPTSVAKFSPSGFYVASGDVHGNVRVWDCVGEDKILKNNVAAISGRINDIDWDGDSQRIIAVGEGKERYGHAFTADSGNSVGEIFGHSAIVNSVAMRKQRPLRAATASDDSSVNFFHGVPYRYNTSIRCHDKYVYDVRYAPNDEKFASVGADGKVFLLDGKTGEKILEFNAHKGTIFSLSWSPDSKKLVTSSADRSVKVWNADDGSLIREWSSMKEQQVGNVWASEDLIISVDVKGVLIYLNPTKDDPERFVYGHQRSITSSFLCPDSKSLYTASYDGVALVWDIKTQNGSSVQGVSHSNQVMDMTRLGDKVISVGMDDTLRTVDIKANAFISESVYTTGYQPVGVCAVGDCIVLATVSDIQVLRDLKCVSTAKTIYQPSCMAAHPSKQEFAVGGEDSCVYVHSFEKDELCEIAQLKNHTSPVTSMVYSHDGKYLACGDASGKVVLYDAETRQVITSRWAFHTGRILGMSWNSNSTHLATASLDTNVHVYSVERPMKYVAVKNAHALGATQVHWLSEDEILSTGSDAAIKTWKLSF